MTVISAMCATAQTATDMPNSKELRPALRAMGTVTKFHRMAIGEPEMAAEKFFDNRCFRRWKQRMEPLAKPLLTDFFVGSMEITGSYDATSAISAIYNPFWDTILLLELKLPEEGGVGSVTKFAMLSGETFRGETPAKYPFTTVVSRGPLFIELAIVFSKTAAHFDKTFPQKATPSLGEFAVSNLEDELKLIGLRAAMRIKLTSELLKDKEDVKLMKSLQVILQNGKRDGFQKIFWDGKFDEHIRRIMTLPDDVREQFVFYSYYKKPNATVFVYIPMFMPRLVVTVTISKDTTKAPTLEMYDLNASEAVLQYYKAVKGGDAK